MRQVTEFCEDMTKHSEVARPALAVKIGHDCEVEMPQKMIKPPDASRTSLAEPRGSGKASLLDVLQSHRCSAKRLRSAMRIPLGTPPSMLLLPDLTPQTQRSSAVPREREEPTESTPKERSRSHSRKPPLPSSPVRLTQTRRQTLVREVRLQKSRE